jgi:hypothetical protein
MMVYTFVQLKLIILISQISPKNITKTIAHQIGQKALLITKIRIRANNHYKKYSELMINHFLDHTGNISLNNNKYRTFPNLIFLIANQIPNLLSINLTIDT